MSCRCKSGQTEPRAPGAAAPNGAASFWTQRSRLAAAWSYSCTRESCIAGAPPFYANVRGLGDSWGVDLGRGCPAAAAAFSAESASLGGSPTPTLPRESPTVARGAARGSGGLLRQLRGILGRAGRLCGLRWRPGRDQAARGELAHSRQLVLVPAPHDGCSPLLMAARAGRDTVS